MKIPSGFSRDLTLARNFWTSFTHWRPKEKDIRSSWRGPDEGNSYDTSSTSLRSLSRLWILSVRSAWMKLKKWLGDNVH